jgi:hypothetical protein
MCDCCKAEGRNVRQRCGDGTQMRTARLYKVYVGRVASIKLCRLCDIQLFRGGESRFLEANIRFAQNLFSSKADSGIDGFF